LHLSLVAALATLTACGPTTEEVVAGPVSWAPGRISAFSATHKYFNFLQDVCSALVP
jgi:hypothetical protein